MSYTLASVAHLLGASSRNQSFDGSIPSQSTFLDCGFNPWSRHIWEATHWCFSLTSMFLSLPPSLSKINEKCPRVRIKKIPYELQLKLNSTRNVELKYIFFKQKRSENSWIKYSMIYKEKIQKEKSKRRN